MLVLESDSPEPPELEIEAGISIAHLYEENTVIIAGTDHVIIRVATISRSQPGHSFR
jgi:hypothetical protein